MSILSETLILDLLPDSLVMATIMGLACTLISVTIAAFPFTHLFRRQDNSPTPITLSPWSKIWMAFLCVARIAVFYIIGLLCVVAAIILGWQGLAEGVLPWLLSTIAFIMLIFAACCLRYACNLSLELQ